MRAHIVLAHPEPQSYNAHLMSVSKDELERQGYGVTVSDLYQMQFDPCERHEHYLDQAEPERFDVQLEQRHASRTKTIPAAVAEEIRKLEEADLLILQYPMWWHLPPAILKGWMDRVFIYGDVYTSKNRFENGRFVAKRAMLSVTVGTSQDTYAHDGRSGDIDLLLWPIHFSLAYVGYEVVPAFVTYGVEAALRYSPAEVVEERLQAAADDLRRRLDGLADQTPLDFNRMADWGEDGRIKPTAPVYSPFIRRNKELQFD